MLFKANTHNTFLNIKLTKEPFQPSRKFEKSLKSSKSQKTYGIK